MRSRTVLISVACSLLFWGVFRRAPSQKPTPETTSAPPQPNGTSSTGVVSFYGLGFDGKQTANGEVFDQTALTAASRTLRFGTRLRVTNPANGRSVVVRVNDRGPFHRDAAGNFDRVLDLSSGAASQLDMIDHGVIRAVVELV